MVKIGRQKNRPNTLVSAASVRWRTLAEKVYYSILKKKNLDYDFTITNNKYKFDNIIKKIAMSTQ